MRTDKQRVLELLEGAFTAKAPPGAAIAIRGAEFEIAIPPGADWRSADFDDAFRDCEQLYYLSPVGFSLYLPGFLRCAIESLDDEVWREKASHVCHHLTRREAAVRASHQEKQFRALDTRQSAAVAAVLLLLEREGVSEATAALDSHWRQLALRG